MPDEEAGGLGEGIERDVDGRVRVPLSPFMTTHIRRPTHLSMSSGQHISLLFWDSGGKYLMLCT